MKSIARLLVSLLMLVVVVTAGQPGSSMVAAQSLQTVIKKSELNLDTSFLEDGDNYSQPKSILVTPIFMGTDVDIDYREWYRGLYYYLSSDRYNFKDIPAHYIIDKDGNLYEGVKGGVERQLLVEGSASKPILIMYLADRADTDISANAQKPIENLLVRLANENAIRVKNIKMSGLQLTINKEKKQVNLKLDTLYGSWNYSFDKIKNLVNSQYQPIPKRYSVKVVEYKNPGGSVKVGAEVVLKIKIKNQSEYSHYAEDDSELMLSTADGKDSALFLNNAWVTKSQLALMPSGSILRPGVEGTYEFKVSAPFIFGRVNQDFILRTAGGQSLGARISVSINVERGNLQVLEIKQTETGTLNIRQDPNSKSPSVGKASPGQRFVWIERSNNGWYKVKHGSVTGWVLGKYVKVI